MNTNETLRNGYDAFISHNHRDKPLARKLADLLATVDYHGRPLRPWLDERFLDPGNLGQDTELTSALDRSRCLLLILSPASVASNWVDFEIKYFLQSRQLEEVIPVLKAPCEIPAVLKGVQLIDFTNESQFDTSYLMLLERLCPAGGPSIPEAKELIELAWKAALDSDPGGFNAMPSPERDALSEALLHFAIDHPATEGLALTGFFHAAQLLLRIHEIGHGAAYNMKMLLGECLAVAMQHHPRYRMVAQRYLDLEPAEAEDPVLAFVVARAYSKLAEINAELVDLGALLRVAVQLDTGGNFNNKKETVSVLIGRIAAKLRGADLGDLFIQTLSEGGTASRIAAIGGISISENHDRPVFYLSKLETMYSNRGEQISGANTPPSRKLLALLFAIDLHQPSIVERHLTNARYDLKRRFGIDDFPYAHTWLTLDTVPPPPQMHHAPFMGTVVKATAVNMEEVALQLNASHVVCLTEPRIVEALFDRAGSFVIPPQEKDSPQIQRMIGRGVPFAMLDATQMAELKDGYIIEVEEVVMRVVWKK